MNTIYKIIECVSTAIKATVTIVIPTALIIAIVIGVGHLAFKTWGFWGVILTFSGGALLGTFLASGSCCGDCCWQTWWLINRRNR